MSDNPSLDNLETQEYEMAVLAANQPQAHRLKYNREMLLKHRTAVMRWLICNDVYIRPSLFKDELHREVGKQRPDL